MSEEISYRAVFTGRNHRDIGYGETGDAVLHHKSCTYWVWVFYPDSMPNVELRMNENQLYVP